MYRKIKNIFFLIIFFNFVFLVTKYYFSEQNVIFTNKSRSSYLSALNDDKNNLPVLENDTSNIIVYINDLLFNSYLEIRKLPYAKLLFEQTFLFIISFTSIGSLSKETVAPNSDFATFFIRVEANSLKRTIPPGKCQPGP